MGGIELIWFIWFILMGARELREVRRWERAAYKRSEHANNDTGPALAHWHDLIWTGGFEEGPDTDEVEIV